MDILQILKYVGVFYLGRMSYMWWKNAVLEAKHQEMNQLCKQMKMCAAELDRKDARIKETYKSLINDTAAINAAMTGGSSHWTEADDILMQSWEQTER